MLQTSYDSKDLGVKSVNPDKKNRHRHSESVTDYLFKKQESKTESLFSGGPIFQLEN
jgi:hypothetical protein